MKQMQLYAGLDVHTETTTGTINGEQGNPVRVLKVETSKEEVKKLFDRLAEEALGGMGTEYTEILIQLFELS